MLYIGISGMGPGKLSTRVLKAYNMETAKEMGRGGLGIPSAGVRDGGGEI